MESKTTTVGIDVLVEVHYTLDAAAGTAEGGRLKTFFDAAPAVTARKREYLVPQCGACKLYLNCRSPKMEIDGDGKKGILIVGESPGVLEDSEGRPFIGPSGRLLEDALEKCGVSLRRDCYITNALRCHPFKNKIENPKSIDYCRPFLIRALNELKPTIVILTGKTPVESLIGWLWREDVGSIGRWLGWRIPSQKLNAWIAPTWHPSYLLRHGTESRDSRTLHMLWERHLAGS